MTFVLTSNYDPKYRHIAEDMYRERKRVFVDLLKWDVPVVDGMFEIDQFDDEHAVYLIATDTGGNHQGSMRLLRTDRPHIVGTLFPELVDGPVPTGSNIYEVTRFCLSPRLRAAERLKARNQIISALVEYALVAGIQAFTGIAEIRWLSQILALGWMCEPLGLPKMLNGSLTGALKINISNMTPHLLRSAGNYRASDLIFTEIHEVAAA